MSAIVVDPWEVVRAALYQSRTEDVNFDGVAGAETLPGPANGLITRQAYEANQTIGPSLRRFAYSLTQTFDMHPPWYNVDPPTSGTVGNYKGVAPLANPTIFENGWINYAGDGFPAAARATAQGELELRGQISHATAGQTGTVWHLPRGLAPARDVWAACPCNAGIAHVYVKANSGIVGVAGYFGGGTAAWIDLAGVRCCLS